MYGDDQGPPPKNSRFIMYDVLAHQVAKDDLRSTKSMIFYLFEGGEHKFLLKSSRSAFGQLAYLQLPSQTIL